MTRVRSILAVLVIAGAVRGVPAQAQVFTDDFESGTLITTDNPPGRWSSVFNGGTGSTTPSALAAHRGLLGMQVIDNDSTASHAAVTGVRASMPSLTGDVYLRYWMRVFRVDAASYFMPAHFHQNGQTIVETSTMLPSAEVTSRTFLPSGQNDASSPGVVNGQWQLYEMHALGMGGSNGSLSMYVDGELVSGIASVDFSTQSLNQLNMGEPWSDPPYRGENHFDDVRVDQAPPAARLVLSHPATDPVPRVGDCVRFKLELRDVHDQVAPAPYVVTPTLQASLPGTFHATPTCDDSPPALVTGAGTVILFFQPEAAGDGTFNAGHLDFLAGPNVSISVLDADLPDGGVSPVGGVPSGPTRGRLDVGFGCAAAPALPLVWMALGALGLLLRRRRA